jgi:hypothetical protein
MVLRSNDRVGIGEINPSHKLHVVGDIRVQTPGTNRSIYITSGSEQDIVSENANLYINNNPARFVFVWNLRTKTTGVYSSRDVKENIEAFATQDARQFLGDLSAVRFNYIDDDNKTDNLGFIAEDVPAIIATSDRKAVNMMNLLTVVTSVVQEQEKEIAALQATVKALEMKLSGSES